LLNYTENPEEILGSCVASLNRKTTRNED